MLELAGIIILGIFAQWLAWKTKVPAILPLIIFGLAVGPLSTLYMADGHKLINPIYTPGAGDEPGSGLFPGESLFYFVSLSIGLILFEGGLTLKRKEIAEVGNSILQLVTVGSLITFVGAGLAAYFVIGLSLPLAFLFSGLIIVTGPTVIAPILQNIPLNRNVAAVLKWEGILIDPVGALVAVLVFEFIRSSDGGMAYSGEAFVSFVQIVLIGLALGGIAGYALYKIIKNELVPHYLLNVFILAYVLTIFVFSDLLAHESGLLSVVVMGLVLANLDVPHIKEILSFKESLSVLLISILFILLAANITMADLSLVIYNPRAYLLFGIVVLVIRPLGVFISTRRDSLSLREKLFISWVGPRGIVAAGIASLFGLTLVREGVAGAEYITPLVFMIVLGTVLINATTARLVAKLLGVVQDNSNGVLIFGATSFAITIAKYLIEQGRHVFMVDSNRQNISRAKTEGINGIVANIYTDDLSEQYELLEVGSLFAFTGSNEVNSYAINRYEDIFGENGAYRLITGDELKKRRAISEENIFSYTDDYINLSDANRESSQIHEVKVSTRMGYLDQLAILQGDKYHIPLFIKSPDGVLHAVPADPGTFDFEEGGEYCISYLGVKAVRPGEETAEDSEGAKPKAKLIP